jgi:hypothetical protein
MLSENYWFYCTAHILKLTTVLPVETVTTSSKIMGTFQYERNSKFFLSIVVFTFHTTGQNTLYLARTWSHQFDFPSVVACKVSSKDSGTDFLGVKLN